MSEAPYVRAAGRFAPTSLYDPLIALTMREGAWRPELVARAGTGDVVDVGCGTGTLAVALARAGASVVGVDGDEDILRRARLKAEAAGVRVEWRHGLAGELPLADASADVAVCTLLLHHLAPAVKDAALRDIRRFLRPGGRLLIGDFGAPADPLQRGAFGVLQLMDGVENTRDHAAGRLPAIVEAAGFAVTPLRRLRTLWGTFHLLEATPTA